MTREARPFRGSEMFYRLLLRAYPRLHREQYGAVMAQLFRDQCRDAWNESRTWGLLELWSRVLPDLAATSILERLAALKERRTMTDKLANLFGFRVTPASTFFRIFALVFLLVFAASVAITFILPECYASTARLKLDQNQDNRPSYDPYFLQTAFETIQSEVVLKPVVGQLKLNEIWGKRYSVGPPLKPADTLTILRQRLQLAPVKKTSLIAVTAFSDDRKEAADIANAVAKSYQAYCLQGRQEQLARVREALETQYRQQETQLQQTRAEMEALQTKFEIREHVESLSPTLVTMETALQKTKVELAQFHTLNPEQQRQVLPLMNPDATLSDLLGKLQAAQQQYVTLTNDYSVTNVVVARVVSLRDELNRQIDDRMAGILSGLETRCAAEQAAAEARLDEQLPKAVGVQITDVAEPGRAPVRPNKPLNIFVGGVAAGLVGVFAAGIAALMAWKWGRDGRNNLAAA